MRILPFAETTGQQREQMAAILVAAFTHAPSAWANLDDARGEVGSFATDPDRMAWVAVEDDAPDSVIGWIGAIAQASHGWELHPLAVDPARQRRGCGRRLVSALEAAAHAAGVLTVWLGSDDDFGGTSLFGAELYPDPFARLAALAPRPDAPYPHPFAFYQRLGYAVVGVLPDVDGPGRHDILMARRIGSPAPTAGGGGPSTLP